MLLFLAQVASILAYNTIDEKQLLILNAGCCLAFGRINITPSIFLGRNLMSVKKEFDKPKQQIKQDPRIWTLIILLGSLSTKILMTFPV